MMDHKRDMQDLNEYRERMLYAMKTAHVCVFEVDIQRQTYTFFENAEDIFGIPGEQILREIQPLSKLKPEEYQRSVSAYFVHPDDWETVDEAFKSIYAGKNTTYQARMKAGNSNYIWCKLDVLPIVENNVPVRLIGVVTDIDKLKQEMAKLEENIGKDGFTGLYSKKYMEKLIERTLKKNTCQKHAFILLDLDNFKRLNDTHGHSAGDDVLKAVAAQLKKSVRKGDIVGRLGGDEFGVFIQDIRTLSEVEEIAGRLLKSEDIPFGVTKSIGISMAYTGGRVFRELYQQADKALYQSKEKKNCYTIYQGGA